MIRTATALILLLLVPTGRVTCWAAGFRTATVTPVGAPIPAAATRSENRLFSADISSDAPNEILLGIYRHEGDAKVLAWSKRIPWLGANAASPTLVQLQRLISNDGRTVILRNRHYNGEVWMWISQGKEPRRYAASDFARVLGSRLVDYEFSRNGIVRFQETLEFIYEPKSVFAMWFPALDEWAVIDLATGELTGPKSNLAEFLRLVPGGPATHQPPAVWLNPPSEDLAKLLNAEATRRSLAAVRKHQPHFIKSLLRPVHEKISYLMSSLKPTAQPVITVLPDVMVSYLFLATRKVPAAEKYIRKLLDSPFRMNLSSTELMNPPTFQVRSDERALADVAWRIWNDVLVDTVDRVDRPFLMQPPAPGYYLGGVSGQLRLPVPSPEKNPGNVWVYLIPADVPNEKWSESDDVIELFCTLDPGGRFPIGGGFRWNMTPRFGAPQFDTVNYSFQTVTPGKYRLKAVWDRREPMANRDSRAIPDAGDYESLESDPFTVHAGSVLAGPTLECTNRVGQADTYYLADETWKRVAPVAMRAKAQPSFPQPMLAFDPFPETDRLWIVKTNATTKITSKFAGRNIQFQKAEVIQVLPRGDPLERDELFLTFQIRGEVEAKARVVPVVRDRHGCTFPATGSLSPLKAGDSVLTVRVPVFPRNEEFTFELRFVPDDTVLCSYTMQNRGAAQKANWTGRPLPIARSFQGDLIRLTQLTRSVGARLEKGPETSATLWTPRSIVYQDSEGNRSLSADEFCREEKVIRVLVEENDLVQEFTAPVAD